MTAIGSRAVSDGRGGSSSAGRITPGSSTRLFASRCPAGARSCSPAKLPSPMERGCQLDTLSGRWSLAALPLVSSIPATFAIFQTPTWVTPPICLAISAAFGLAWSAPMICARFSAESRFPCSAPASVMPAALAILPTVVLLTPLIFRATCVAFGLSASSPMICAYSAGEIPRRPRAALPAVSSMPAPSASLTTVL
jgi:hypothetical protein